MDIGIEKYGILTWQQLTAPFFNLLQWYCIDFDGPNMMQKESKEIVKIRAERIKRKPIKYRNTVTELCYFVGHAKQRIFTI